VSGDPGESIDKPEAGAPLRFRLPVYEGPLDLLLHLIKRAELDPHDVTASIITEQYLDYLEVLEALNLDVAGEYLVMASTLLLIKSFSMLPHPEAADAEEADELKRDLVERLLEYQRYREAGAKLGERPLLGRDVFATAGETIPETERLEAPLKVSVFDLMQAMAAVLKKLTDRQPRELELRDIPIAQCIPRVIEAIRQSGRIEFSTLFGDLGERPIVIATFIALLELIRQRRVRAFQEVRFGPIWLERGEMDSDPAATAIAPHNSE